MPLYWMYEKSGRLKDIVHKFLNDEELGVRELDILKWYVQQWASGMPNHPKDLDRIYDMDQEELKRYISDVLGRVWGIDPF